MKTELGWRTCIIVDLLHLPGSHSDVAHLKPAVLKIRGEWMTSVVRKIRDVQKINAAQKSSDEPTRITTPLRRHITRQLMGCQRNYHRCTKGHHQYTLQFMNYHRHHLPLLQRSIQQMSGNARESVLNTRLHPPQLESLNVLLERWMLMKIMMMMERKKRRVALYQLVDPDLDPPQEMRKPLPQPE
jgi:hypothetical protein